MVVPLFLLIPSEYNANSPHENPRNRLRIGLHDRLIYLTPLFTPTWFSDAFIALFGYPCYFLTECGSYFSTFLFIQATITPIIKLYKTTSIKYNFKQNFTTFNSKSHGFLNILTAEMENDLNDTHHQKSKLALKSSKSSSMTHVIDNPLDDFSHSDDQTNHVAAPTGITSPPPFYTKRPNKFNRIARFKLLPKRNPHSKTNHKFSSLHSSTIQIPTSPNYSTVNKTPNDNSFDITSANNDNDSPLEVYSKTINSSPPPTF